MAADSVRLVARAPPAIVAGRRDPAGPERGGPQAARRALRQACRHNDAAAAAAALLQWSACFWDEPPTSLAALAARLPEDQGVILALERALYARQAADWDGGALWYAVKSGGLRPPAAAADRPAVLAPLYPAQRPAAG